MLLHFSLVNLQTGETAVPAYLDANEILGWNRWKVPDDASGNLHRSLRGKLIIVLTTKTGMSNWTDESFDSVSARILEARGQKDRAEIHAAASAAQKTAELHTKISSLAI